MFLGHFGLGLAAKRAAPTLPLAVSFAACQLLDLIWPVLVIVGVERVHVEPGATRFTPLAFDHYPWSHSLTMALVWSLLAAGLLWALRRSRRAVLVLALLVASHWLLDWVSHRPDLPVWLEGGPRLGMGLWNSVAGTLAVELALFTTGLWLYGRATAPADRKGRWVLGALVAALLLIYAGAAFGSIPPRDTPASTLAAPALAMWLLVAWAGWADRHRRARRAAEMPADQRGGR